MSELPPNNLWQQLTTSSRVRSLLMFLLLFTCGWALIQLLTYFSTLIFVFVTAAIAAALLNYPVQWISRFLPRQVAVFVVFFLSLAILIGLVVTLGLEVINQGQSLIEKMTEFLKNSSLEIPDYKFFKAIEQNFDKILQTLQTGLMSGLGFLQGFFSNFMLFIIIAVICLYMLLDGRKVWVSSLQIIPLEIRDRFAFKMQRSFLGFFRAQLTLMLFLASFTFIVFTLLGVNYTLLLSLVMGIFDAIPGIGATLGVLIVTLLVISSQGFVTAIKVLIACLILQQIQDNLIAPKIMKDNLDIHPVLLFFALFVGEKVAGILGIFLSIPIAAMITTWYDEKDI